MVVYEAIWIFISTYIVGNPNDLSIWGNGSDTFFIFRFLNEGSDGRLVSGPLTFNLDSIPYFLTHFLTILACVSLCVMLWKLITLPIKWAIKRAE